jgi:hypothetical protein
MLLMPDTHVGWLRIDSSQPAWKFSHNQFTVDRPIMGCEPAMPEDPTEEIEETTQMPSQKVATSDVCETPSPPAPGEVPIPYPNTSQASDTTSGSKMVKTEGQEVMAKGATYQKSSGDEPGQSEPDALKKIVNAMKNPKLLNIPIPVWGTAAVILVILIWILTSRSPQPIEPMEQAFRLISAVGNI